MQKDSDLPSYDYATFPRRFLSYRWFKPLLVALLTFVFMVVFQCVVAWLVAWLAYLVAGMFF